MQLTCEKCHTAYRLDPKLLGTGRMVRCTECEHIWFQAPEGAKRVEPAAPSPEADLSEMIVFEETAAAPDDHAEEEDEDEMPFREMLAENAKQNAEKPLPQSLAPKNNIGATVTYQPMGMGAGQFGFMVFLLCLFLTLIPAFLAKKQIVQHFPVMAHLYKTLGLHIAAPGEGLRFTEMLAERRDIDGQKVLAVEAKLANITEQSLPYPAVLVTLKSAYGATLKEWDFKPENATLKSGESVPVKLEFKDAPEDGKSVEIHVFEP